MLRGIFDFRFTFRTDRDFLIAEQDIAEHFAEQSVSCPVIMISYFSH